MAKKINELQNKRVKQAQEYYSLFLKNFKKFNQVLKISNSKVKVAKKNGPWSEMNFNLTYNDVTFEFRSMYFYSKKKISKFSIELKNVTYQKKKLYHKYDYSKKRQFIFMLNKEEKTFASLTKFVVQNQLIFVEKIEMKTKEEMRKKEEAVHAKEKERIIKFLSRTPFVQLKELAENVGYVSRA